MSTDQKFALELNLNTRAWGLSIDNKNLYLTAIHKKLNQIEYKGFESLPDYDARSDEDIQDFIEEFLGRYGVKRGDVFLVLPRNQVTIQIAEFPSEAKDNLEEVMEYQLDNFFPGDLEDLQFFPQVIGESDQLKVMIVAIKKENLGQAFGLIRRWNLKLAGITLETFALANGMTKTDSVKFNKSKVVVFRHFEKGLELAAFNQGRLQTSYYFDWEEEDTEAWTHHLEQAFSESRIDPNDVEWYLEVGEPGEPMSNFLRESLGIPFESWDDTHGNPIEPQAWSGFGAAVTAIHEKVDLDLNMLPENLRKTHKHLPFVLGTIVLLLIGVFFIISEISDYRGLKKEAAQVEKRHAQVMAQMNEISQARGQYESKKTELELYKRYRTSSLLMKMLASMSSELPDDTYLTNFQVKNGDRLTIQGESEDPFGTQAILSGMPFLKDVEPGNAITQGRNKDGKKRFMFKAKIDLEALR